MNNDNKKTLEAYETSVDEYNAAAVPKVIGHSKEWIDAGLALLPKDGRILELGSSHGRDAKYMEEKGFKVDRTDAAASFVKYMKHQGYEARLLDALTDEYGGPYDMVFANAILLHFTAEQIETVLSKVRESLTDQGLFSFSVKIGDGDSWSAAKLKSPRYFSYWREQSVREFLQKTRFEVVFWEAGQTGHDNGDWYHVIAKKL